MSAFFLCPSAVFVFMKALLFAAGLGTRLRPLTQNCPKALVEVNGQALLGHALHYLQRQGVCEVVVNIHHFGALVMDYLEQHTPKGLIVRISDERDQVLETGGGLLKAAPLLQGKDPIVLYNVDVLTNLSLTQLLEYHQTHQALATLAVRRRSSSRYLLFDATNRLSGWRHQGTGEERLVRPASAYHPFAFSGIHIIAPELLERIPQRGVFSIIESYLSLAKSTPILAYPHDSDYWFDVGSPAKLATAQAFLAS